MGNDFAIMSLQQMEVVIGTPSCVDDVNKKAKKKAIMCDTKKYFQIYQDIKNLTPEDTLQLVLEADNKEEQDFYFMIGDFLLQQRQKIAIEGNLF